MAKDAFDSIMAGLEDAFAYARGDESRGKAHTRPSPVEVEVDVRAIRARTKLSRAKFAERFGLDPRAIQEWEQGRRRPDRSSRILLRVIERHPEAVEDALKAAIP